MRKLILKSNYALGDIVLMTAAVRDLHRCYPGAFVTDVRTPCGELWNYSPYLQHLDENDPAVETIRCDPTLIDWANHVPYHALEGYIDNLNEQLGLHVKCCDFKGDLHLSPSEKRATPLIRKIAGDEIPYWLIFAGGRHEITIKWWDTDRYQEVVDYFRGKIQFVQAGSAADYHPKLKGTIDLRGKTGIRQLLQLVYHSQGVLCGVTGPMHLAAAVELKGKARQWRPCVVVAGGRESPQWEAYPGHQILHTIGALPCCSTGGCWKNRTVPLGDGSDKDKPDQLCVDVRNGLPRCMDLITSADVIRSIEHYFDGGSIGYLTKTQAAAGRKAIRHTSVNPIDSSPLNISNARYACEKFIRSLPEFRTNPSNGNGIVICAGGSLNTGAWLCLKVLRQLGCTLPVEVWYRGSHSMDPSMKRLFGRLKAKCINASETGRNQFHGLARDPALKPYAALRSRFRNVLLLDADTIPARNPEYLFKLSAFQSAGAISWPGTSISRIDLRAWHLCGLKPRQDDPIGARTMLINKEKCWKALALWSWFDEQPHVYDPYLLRGEYAAHFAFRKINIPFRIPTRSDRKSVFQYDLAGKLLFQHRNQDQWNLYLTSDSIPHFRFEKECRQYLDELRRIRGAHPVPARRTLFERKPSSNGQARAPLASPPRRKSSAGRAGVPFTLVTLYDAAMKDVGAITSQALREYASTRGYRSICHDRLLDPLRHPCWNKILAVRNALLEQRTGWVMWVDADAMIMNHRIALETLIPKNRDLVCASDFNGLVSGIFLIRHCEWSLKFLETISFLGDVIRDPDGFGPKWEQNTMKHVIDNFVGFKERVALLPERTLNSNLSSFQPGDFVLHLGVTANGNRQRVFRSAQKWILK